MGFGVTGHRLCCQTSVDMAQSTLVAVEFQSGPSMTALIRLVTYDCPAFVVAGGCSLT